MHLRYDRTCDAAYLYLRPLKEGEKIPAKTVIADGGVHLDFDADGRLFGFEVLYASKKLPLELLPQDDSPLCVWQTVE